MPLHKAVQHTLTSNLAHMDARSCITLRELIQRALNDHERVRQTVPEAVLPDWDDLFRTDVMETLTALDRLDNRLRSGPDDPIGHPEVEQIVGREHYRWSPEQVAMMQPWYAAYVRAHDHVVPAGRNDVYSSWLEEQRQIFFEKVLGHRVPRTEMDPVTQTPSYLRRQLLDLEHKDNFTQWLAERWPAAASAGEDLAADAGSADDHDDSPEP